MTAQQRIGFSQSMSTPGSSRPLSSQQHVPHTAGGILSGASSHMRSAHARVASDGWRTLSKLKASETLAPSRGAPLAAPTAASAA
eukprot:3927760-Prymnesium_polylepis.1